MHSETLMAFARTARAVAASSAGFALFARAKVTSNISVVFAHVVHAAVSCGLRGMHLGIFFVLAVSVAADADVVILVEDVFATIAMHVDIRQLFVAQAAMEIAVPIATRRERGT